MTKITSAKIIQHSASTLKNDMTVSDGDKIKFGNSELTVFHTPGHSKDSMCLVGDGKIFSGIRFLLVTVEELIFLAEVQRNSITVC